MIDDAECLRRYAESHDESAFAEFVRRQIDFVYSAALRQSGHDAHLAQDIVQQVFLAAARKAAALARHPVVAAWLHQATRYAAIDAVRSRRRREARELAADPSAAMNTEPEAPVAWEKISPELDRMVAALGERDRAAVILRFFRGKSFAEIGGQLHVSESAARMRVERALEKLRTRLARSGITSSAAALGAILAENSVAAAPASLGPTAIATAVGAPAAGGLTAALAAFHLMTSAKIIPGLVTLVALASIVVAVHEHNQARTAERALADAARPRPAALRDVTTSSPIPASSRGPSGETAAKPATSAAAAHPGSPFGALLELLDNPAMQKLNGIQAKLRLDGQYSALFKSLSLTPDQVDQFKNLIVEKQMVGFDSMSAAHAQGVDVRKDPKAFLQVVTEAEKAVDTQIATLLGADGYSQFQHYQITLPARNTASLLTEALGYTATPLNETQADNVIQLLAQHGTAAVPPDNPFTVLNADLGIVKLSDAGLAQLRSVLSAPQLEALQAKIQQQGQLLQARQHLGGN